MIYASNLYWLQYVWVRLVLKSCTSFWRKKHSHILIRNKKTWIEERLRLKLISAVRRCRSWRSKPTSVSSMWWFISGWNQINPTCLVCFVSGTGRMQWIPKIQEWFDCQVFSCTRPKPRMGSSGQDSVGIHFGRIYIFWDILDLNFL